MAQSALVYTEEGYPTGVRMDGSKVGVLCVDDSQFILKQLTQIFASRNFEVVGTANDGKQAIAFYKEHMNKVQLITMDITMPEMDGLQALKAIREMNPEAMVIMVTAIGAAESVKESILLGAKGYIVKPLDRNKVLERLGQILK